MANFLGKKISLISKAGIRYEGILYTIDQVAFTVALSKVKSFGTEDRATDRYIAARDEVYEYIIFRGSDISDLHVCENSLYTDDSAIVQIMSPNITNPSSPPVLTSATAVPTSSSSSSHLHGTDLNVSDIKHNHQESMPLAFQPPISISKRFMEFSKINTRIENQGLGKTQEQSSNQRNSPTEQFYFDKYDSGDLEEIAVQDYRQFKNRDQSKPKTDFYDNFDDNTPRYSNYKRSVPQQRGFRNSEPNRGSTYGRGFARGGGGSGRAYRINNELPLDSIKDDFDFESSNALMAEEFAHMNVAAVSHDSSIGSGGHEATISGDNADDHNADNDNDPAAAEDDKAFYDKKKSFFDNISSEVTDRGTNNSDRRHRNNMETFGVADQYNRGGVGGGRGGYRGGGGGNRWNRSRGAFRGGGGAGGWYSRGSSAAGFLRRGSNGPRGESSARSARGAGGGPSNQRRLAGRTAGFDDNI